MGASSSSIILKESRGLVGRCWMLVGLSILLFYSSGSIAQVVQPNRGEWISGIWVSSNACHDAAIVVIRDADMRAAIQKAVDALNEWNNCPGHPGYPIRVEIAQGTCVSNPGALGAHWPPPTDVFRPETLYYEVGSCMTAYEGTDDVYQAFGVARAIECPAGYERHWLDFTNNIFDCEVLEEAVCPKGNPVSPLTGSKYLDEVDYRSGEGMLELKRSYYSAGHYQPGATMTHAATDHWRHNFDRRVVVVNSSSPLTAYVDYPNGKRRHFGASGSELFNSDGAAAQLTPAAGGWQLSLPDSSVERYDSSGRLVSIRDRAGAVTELTYGLDGRLQTVVDAFGRSLTFSYQADKLSSVTMPGGASIIYSYDGFERLAGVAYPDGASRTYIYEARRPWLLVGINDEQNQRFATYSYDDESRVTQTEHAGGADRYGFNYLNVLSTAPRETQVTDPLGATRTYRTVRRAGVWKPLSVVGGACATCGSAQSQSYDGFGNVSQKNDFNGYGTTYTYDTVRNLETSRREGLNSSGGTTPRTRTISTQWHPTYRIPTRIDEPGRRTTYTHDASGNVLTRTVLDTATSESRTWTHTYDGLGRVLTEDGPRSDLLDLTTYTYYTCTTGYQCGQIHTITNAAGHVTIYNTYNAHGQPLTITDPNGVATTLTYDLRQRLTSRTVGAEQTVFTYWPTGLLKKATLPDGSFLEYTYDAAHRLTGINDAEGKRIEYTLDAMGNRTAENLYDPSNALTQTRARVFNTLNQLWKEIGAAGTADVTTTYGYDNNGNQTSIAAPLGRNSGQTYDELNRLTQVTDPLSGITQYGYNALDQLISVTDPRNLTTSYTYNALGDLQLQSNPDSGVTSFTYDQAGNVATRTDARGATIGRAIYSYDALNRPTQIQYHDHTTSYTYDTCLNGIGRLCAMTDASGSTSYEYDAQGRVTRKSQTIILAPGYGTQTREVRYTYENGRLIRLRMPSGAYVHYGYDAAGRISAVGWSMTEAGVDPLLSNVLYDSFGGVRGWTWANGTQAVREYDQDGRLTIVDSAGAAQLVYDDANRITGITTDGSTPSWTYGYDLLDRLTGATRTGLNRTYTYDANGNRQTQGGTQSSTYGYSNPLTSNRLASISGSLSRTYSYDAAGSVTGDGVMMFTHNGAGRMNSAGNTQYFHNGIGQRVLKRYWPGNEVGFVHDEAGHVIEKCVAWVESECNEWSSQQFVWLGDIPVAAILETAIYDAEGYIRNKYLEAFNIHTDHLNAPRSLTRANASNDRVWRWDSDPFGIGIADGNVAGGEHFYEFDLRFPGQVVDAESGLHYNYYRDYDPATGRYVQSDPIGLEGGLNTYAYVKSNPLSLVDPFGLDSRAEPRPCFGCWPFGDTHTRPPGGWTEVEWIKDFVDGLNNMGQVITGVCNPAIPDAKPNDLCEQLALAEAKAGAGVPIMSNLGDAPRLVAHYGPGPWIKMQHTHVCADGRKLVIHYFTNGRGSNVELKFVGR